MMFYNKIINKRLHLTCIFTCLMLISNISFAQRNPKYENVVKKASELDKEEAFGEYSDFLSLNPFIERANLYYQLAELSSSIMRDLNPIIDYHRIKNMYNIFDSYYLICEQYLNDNEARKDQSLFPAVHTVQRKLLAQDISLYINTKRGIDSMFFADMSATFRTYTLMVESYYDCMNAYKNICKKNRNINDLYINWSENNKLISLLITKFDSVQYYKNLFNSNNEIPDINFTYKNIADFKIDGFSPADFRNTAELWDYKSWATRQQKYYDDMVRRTVGRTSVVQKKLDLHIRDLNESKKPIPSENYADNELMVELKELQEITPLYFDIERKYRIIDFLNLVYDERNTSTSNNYTITNQAHYIHSLIEAYSKMLTVYKTMESRYPSMKHNVAEMESLSTLYNSSIENYKQYIINSKIASKEDSFIYNKANIPKISGSGFYRPSNSGYIVKNILKNEDGSTFLGGAYTNTQGYSIAFTAFSADTKNINWLKTIDISKIIYDDCSMSLYNIPTGVMSLVTSKNVSDPSLTTQTIVKYDIKGAEKQKITLPEKNLPLGRNILYDEISESILLTFYGNTEEWFRDSVLIVQQLSTDNQQKFRSDIKFSGELINIYPSYNGQFIIFGNYVEFDVLGKKESTGLGLFSLIIDSEGKVIKQTIYPSDNPRYGIYVSRISPEMFLVSGTGGSIRKNDANLVPSEGEPVVILTSGNGDLIYDYKKIKPFNK